MMAIMDDVELVEIRPDVFAVVGHDDLVIVRRREVSSWAGVTATWTAYRTDGTYLLSGGWARVVAWRALGALASPSSVG